MAAKVESAAVSPSASMNTACLQPARTASRPASRSVWPRCSPAPPTARVIELAELYAQRWDSKPCSARSGPSTRTRIVLSSPRRCPPTPPGSPPQGQLHPTLRTAGRMDNQPRENSRSPDRRVQASDPLLLPHPTARIPLRERHCRPTAQGPSSAGCPPAADPDRAGVTESQPHERSWRRRAQNTIFSNGHGRGSEYGIPSARRAAGSSPSGHEYWYRE